MMRGHCLPSDPFAERMFPMTRPIFVAGHRGMVGGALVRRLQAQGCDAILTATRQELDLTDQKAVDAFFATHRPAQAYLAAAKVGGILANSTYPADFIYDNLMVESNFIHAAFRHGVERLLFLGSSCIYPRMAEQPIREEALLTGPLEPTNEPYAIAKIAGIKLCEAYNRQYGTDFRSVMPTNLYGPGDNFDLSNSHVIPALMRKFHDAKVTAADHVLVWGTGTPRREFLYVDDMADACVHVMGLDQAACRGDPRAPVSHLNVGTGKDLSIADLAHLVQQTVGFEGEIRFDVDKPDGTPRKLLDVTRLAALDWHARTPLEEGLRQTYTWFLANWGSLRN